jgi:transposase
MNPLIPHASDREFAERSRVARGFSSFKDWRNQNRRAAKDLRSKMSKRKTAPADKERLARLVSILESEFMTLILPNL